MGDVRPAGIAQTLDFRLGEVSDRFVTCGGLSGGNVLHPFGVVQGGYLATLLNTACGFATLSMLEAGAGRTTVELKVAYHKALRPSAGGSPAEGRIVSIGRNVAFAVARPVDGKGALFTATSGLFIILSERDPGLP
jgi:uncharacterized protein (TIGR00369 family)